MKDMLPFALVCCGFLGLLAAFAFPGSIPLEAVHLPAALHIPQKNSETSDTAALLFVGDVMLDRGVEWAVHKYGQGDWTWPFRYAADFLNEADLVFGNLESQISDKGVKVGSIYSFRADPESIEALQYAGFDAVSVANNHSFDYTREAFEDSLVRLAEARIMPVADALMIQEVKDTRIGLLGYSNFPGPAFVTWDNLEQVSANIAQARTKVDILAVSLHAGEEYVKEPNEFQRAFATAAIDAGADLVIGHHSHVVQPLEQYQQGWIAYGLGNFIFDQDFSTETMQGAMLKVVLQDKKVKEAVLLPTHITPTLQVRVENQ